MGRFSQAVSKMNVFHSQLDIWPRYSLIIESPRLFGNNVHYAVHRCRIFLYNTLFILHQVQIYFTSVLLEYNEIRNE